MTAISVLSLFAAVAAGLGTGYFLGCRRAVCRSLSVTDPDVLWKIAQSYQRHWTRGKKAVIPPDDVT